MNSIFPVHTHEYLLTRKCNMNCSYCFEKDKTGTDADLERVYNFLIQNGDSSDIQPARFYMFGGEPLLNVEFLEQLIHKIEETPSFSENTKRKYINSIVNSITTNGTLIDKHIDFFKKYNASFQISLDGPEDVNDACRVDYNGKGHFKQIMDNIKLCQENGINYNIHGAVSKSNYKNFARIIKWFIEIQLDNKNNMNKVPEFLYHNYLQLVFEDDISDDDINTLLEQYQEAIEIILFSDLLSDYSAEDRKKCAEGFLARTGGKCSAANSMFAFDGDMYIYPCHRLMTSGVEKTPHEFALGQIGSDKPWNYKLYEQFLDAPNKGIVYGPVFDFVAKDENVSFMANWCPSTNFEQTKLTNTYPCKHDVLLAELQNFIPRLAEYYNLDIYGYIKEHRKKR